MKIPHQIVIVLTALVGIVVSLGFVPTAVGSSVSSLISLFDVTAVH